MPTQPAHRILLGNAYLAASLLWAATAAAQSFCASDDQPPPVALHERFINADCAACWTAVPAGAPDSQALVIDWIVPAERGDDAPLSAAATRDARTRLAQLGAPLPSPTQATSHTRARNGDAGQRLRVAHGLPFNDYIAIALRLDPLPEAATGDLRAWLAVVESVPAGTEGSPVARNLVRNTYLWQWDQQSTLSNSKQSVDEFRPLYLPDNVKPDRLRVVGWVEDATGRMLAAAASACLPEGSAP